MRILQPGPVLEAGQIPASRRSPGSQAPRRLGQDQPGGREGGQGGQYFPDAPGQAGPPLDTVGNIGPQPFPQSLQLFPGQAQIPEPVQAHQDRRCIGAAPGQAGGHGDPLLKINGGPLLHPVFFFQEEGSPVGQVFFPGKAGVGAVEKYLPRPPPLQNYPVVEGNGLHDHFHLMVTIGTAAQDIQGQIYLGIGR